MFVCYTLLVVVVFSWCAVQYGHESRFPVKRFPPRVASQLGADKRAWRNPFPSNAGARRSTPTAGLRHAEEKEKKWSSNVGAVVLLYQPGAETDRRKSAARLFLSDAHRLSVWGRQYKDRLSGPPPTPPPVHLPLSFSLSLFLSHTQSHTNTLLTPISTHANQLLSLSQCGSVFTAVPLLLIWLWTCFICIATSLAPYIELLQHPIQVHLAYVPCCSLLFLVWCEKHVCKLEGTYRV